jgi:hypothetical protein
MEEMLESVDMETEVDADLGEVETTEETAEDPAPEAGTEQAEADDPYSSKSSKEFSAALKAWRDSSPENAKYARMAKDDHARLFQLQQVEPKGITGVQEKYALLDSVIHGLPDGTELRGADALGAIQDELRSVAETDELLAAGDPRALDNLGEEFNEGLAKLAPTILDRIRDSNPEAYAAAVLPHFVAALAQSDLVQNYNGLVDVLNEQPPSWLTADQKGAWQADKMTRIFGLAGNMGKWLNAQASKAGELPKHGAGTKTEKDSFAEERQAFDQEKQEAHWNANISPKLDQHASEKFNEDFKPFEKRLRLDSAARSALKMEYSKRIAGMAARPVNGKPNPYMSQIQRYRAAKNPDPATVTNFAKVEFNKHSKAVMDALINERYKSFLNGKPKATTTTTAAAAKGPVPPGVTIVGTKPANIDFKRTPLDWIHQKKYRTTDGKIVQVRQ